MPAGRRSRPSARPFLLGLLLAICLPAATAEAAEGPPPPDQPAVEAERLNDTVFGRAVRWERTLSSTVSSTTGLAISPLLGMGALGLWEYVRTEPELRHRLPWYTHPWAWGICLGIFLVANLKDTAGVLIPEAVKKPLGVLDVLENQFSAAIVALAVLPASAVARMPEALPEGGLREGGGSVLWAVVPPPAWPFLLVPFLLVIFGTVAMVSHAFRCLLLLSPSSLVTAGVKVAKGVFLAVFAATAYLLPWVGLALSVLIILVCARLFGWAWRWNVYGTLFAYDFLGSRFDRPLPEGEPVRGFYHGGGDEVAPRSYGRLERTEEGLVFTWRPWPLALARRKRIELDGALLGVRKGMVVPAVTLRPAGSGGFRTLLELRLRYRTHEEEVARRFGAGELQPSRVIQGARNAAAWLWGQIRNDLEPVPALSGER